MSEEETGKLKIDFSEMTDLTVESKSCKCTTVFFKEAKYRTSRLNPCEEHKKNNQDAARERSRIVQAARVKRDEFFQQIHEGKTPV